MGEAQRPARPAGGRKAIPSDVMDGGFAVGLMRARRELVRIVPISSPQRRLGYCAEYGSLEPLEMPAFAGMTYLKGGD